jgi:hypothetical protein
MNNVKLNVEDFAMVLGNLRIGNCVAYEKAVPVKFSITRHGQQKTYSTLGKPVFNFEYSIKVIHKLGGVEYFDDWRDCIRFLKDKWGC